MRGSESPPDESPSACSTCTVCHEPGACTRTVCRSPWRVLAYPAMLRNHRSGTPLHGRNNERAAERAERRAHNQGAQRTRAKRAAAWTHHTRPPSHRVKSQPPSHRASQESPSQAQDQDQDQAHSPSPVAALRLVLPAAPARSGKKHPAHKRAFSISIRNC